MARSVSAGFLQAVYAERTSQIHLLLISLDHITFASGIKRFVRNPVAIVSRGITFEPAGVDIQFPRDAAEEASLRAQLAIENTSLELIDEIRALGRSPVSVTMELVQSVTPNTVEYSLDGLEMRDIGYNLDSIRGTLMTENLDSEPFPKDSFDPARFPGLYI